MAVKLHRCSVMWVERPAPVLEVQHALDEAGIEYEVVKHPPFPRSRRKELEAKTGQRKLPAIEFEDGTTLREESKDLAARIRAGHESPSVGAARRALDQARRGGVRAASQSAAPARSRVDRVGMPGVSR